MAIQIQFSSQWLPNSPTFSVNFSQSQSKPKHSFSTTLSATASRSSPPPTIQARLTNSYNFTCYFVLLCIRHIYIYIYICIFHLGSLFNGKVQIVKPSSCLSSRRRQSVFLLLFCFFMLSQVFS